MLLLDVLQEITRCSKVFQKEVIDFDQEKHIIDATLETKRSYQGVEPKKYHQRSKEFVNNLGKEFVACVESDMTKYKR
ncbi:hypothetical protein ACJMK2_044497 [Sinanodonta woodiana]|uniref:Uncharacterized protein n=1 Tax=Sinanodonta woodiana TaxID=1069815 RepID=A0ABD3W3I9_SINWO